MKTVHRFIKFNQKAWLKSYIEINAELKNKAKDGFNKDFFNFMNNSDFVKSTENVKKKPQKCRDTILIAAEKRRNYLVSEPNDQSSNIVYIIGDNIYEDIEKDVETKFDTSNYGLGRPLRKGKNKKIIGFMIDELG